MGVVCRPLECPESPELTSQSWSCKMTATISPLPLLDCNYWPLQLAESSSKLPLRRKRSASAVVTLTSPPPRYHKRRRIQVDHHHRQQQPPNVGSPRSLQFALPELSSVDTLGLLHAVHCIPSELRHLNGRCVTTEHDVQQVFGWRHLLCQEERASSTRVIWKSAKALEALRMRPLARQIWHGNSTRVLCTVNKTTRVVRSRRARGRDQIWVERFLDDGLQVCVARKELRHFTEFHAPESAATECQGYLVRPVFAKTINPQVLGCSVQCLRAVDAKGCNGAKSLKKQLIKDLPRLTLQWEEEHVYDLVAAPQVLLDSVFAQGDD